MKIAENFVVGSYPTKGDPRATNPRVTTYTDSRGNTLGYRYSPPRHATRSPGRSRKRSATISAACSSPECSPATTSKSGRRPPWGDGNAAVSGSCSDIATDCPPNPRVTQFRNELGVLHRGVRRREGLERLVVNRLLIRMILRAERHRFHLSARIRIRHRR